jgi:hypothetical protein
MIYRKIFEFKSPFEIFFRQDDVLYGINAGGGTSCLALVKVLRAKVSL